MTRIDITLNSNPVDGNNFFLELDVPTEVMNPLDINPGDPFYKSPNFIFKNTVSGSEDVWIRPTIAMTSESLWGKISDYFILYEWITVEQKDNGAVIYVDREGVFSYDVIEGDISITITTFETGITVTGLESNAYLINNQIWLELSSTDTVEYFTLFFENLSNGKTSNTLYSYTFSNKSRVDISPVIKSMFDYPDIKNDNYFKITILSSTGQTITFLKSFIRGGKRTNDTNQNLTANTILRPSEKLPVWDGFPTDEYYLDGNFDIKIRPFADINPLLKDYKRVKGCNGLYLKFLNQSGGYSNWYFESASETESGGSVGVFVRDNKLDDFGSDSDNGLQVYSKVPKEYIGLIKDLIVSPEIYKYDSGNWIRISASKNNIERDNSKRAYSVRIKFDFNYRFNPTLLW